MTCQPRSLGLLLVQGSLLPWAIWQHSNTSALMCYTKNKTKNTIHHSFQQLVSFLSLKEKLGKSKSRGFFLFLYIFFLVSKQTRNKKRPMERKGKQGKCSRAQWPHTAIDSHQNMECVTLKFSNRKGQLPSASVRRGYLGKLK